MDLQRSGGVTFNAVFALAGSVLTLAVGVILALAVFITAPAAASETPKDFPLPPEFFKALLALVPLMYVLPAAWGISTGIGLLRLKNWARISITVFASLLTAYGLFGAMGAVIIALVPLSGGPGSPQLDPAALGFVRAFMVIFALSQLGLGIWWLVFFNRAKTRIQFQPQAVRFSGAPPPPLPLVPPPPTRSAPPTRPISITIIAVYLLAASAFVPATLALRAPAVLFTTMVTGWTAAVYYLVLLALVVYVGVGLLRVQPAARLAGMAYLAFTIVNSTVFCFTPGGHARVVQLLAAEMSLFPWMQAWLDMLPMRLDLTPFVMIGTALGMAVPIACLYFLFTHKSAFDKHPLTPAD
jgi:hypothetical protein